MTLSLTVRRHLVGRLHLATVLGVVPCLAIRLNTQRQADVANGMLVGIAAGVAGTLAVTHR